MKNKLKTKKAAAKRFFGKANGLFKRGQAFKRHILTKKTTKNKRALRGMTIIHHSDLHSINRLLPYA